MEMYNRCIGSGLRIDWPLEMQIGFSATSHMKGRPLHYSGGLSDPRSLLRAIRRRAPRTSRGNIVRASIGFDRSRSACSAREHRAARAGARRPSPGQPARENLTRYLELDPGGGRRVERAVARRTVVHAVHVVVQVELLFFHFGVERVRLRRHHGLRPIKTNASLNPSYTRAKSIRHRLSIPSPKLNCSALSSGWQTLRSPVSVRGRVAGLRLHGIASELCAPGRERIPPVSLNRAGMPGMRGSVVWAASNDSLSSPDDQ